MKTRLCLLLCLMTFKASANPAVNLDERCYEPRDTLVYELTQRSVPSEHVLMAEVRYSPPLAMKDDSVLVAGKDRRIYFLSEDGNSRIVAAIPPGKASSPLIMLKDGTIVFGADDGKVYFIGPDGKIKASVAVGQVSEAPVILKDGTIVVVPLLNSGVAYFFDQNGATKARFTLNDTGPTRGLAPLLDGGVVFGGLKDIYFLNADSTRRAVFKIPTADVGVVSSAVVLNDGTVVVGVGGQSLYFLNPNGTQKAVFKATSVSALAALSNGGVVAGSGTSIDGKVYFLNSDGTQKAVFKPAYPVLSITEMKDGTIVTISELGQLYILNPDGTKKAEFNNLEYRSPPTSLSDGTIVVGSLDEKVHFLKMTSAVKKVKYLVACGNT